MGEEAAEEMVRIMLNGTEVMVRVAGATAQSLAAILHEYKKNEQKVYGRTPLMKLLYSGETLSVVSLTKDQYGQFKSFAKKLIVYAPIVNRKQDDGKVDVVFSEKSAALVNHILYRIHYEDPDRENPEDPGEIKKKRSPSRSSLSYSGPRERRENSTSAERKQTEPRSPILEQLERNRRILNESAEKKQDLGLDKIVEEIKKRREMAK